MLYVFKTQNPSFIWNISLENDIQCKDLEEQGKGVKKFFLPRKVTDRMGCWTPN